MKLITVVIVYNNRKILDNAVRYINEQTYANFIEILAIDNSNGKFSSAAAALNYGAIHSKGEVLAFMHQDFYLLDQEILERVYLYCKKNIATIVGAAGVKEERDCIISDIFDTKEKLKRYKPTENKVVDVFSVDECFFAMHRTLWEKYKFDESTCDNWHFYAVDICVNNILNGGLVVVMPMSAWHYSGGLISKQFYLSLVKIIKKYKKYRLKYISTTCVKAPNNYLGILKYTVKAKLS